MKGPGRYDDQATVVRLATNASAVILIVIDGNRGSGFTVQAEAPMLRGLAELLEYMAQEIRADLPPKDPDA